MLKKKIKEAGKAVAVVALLGLSSCTQHYARPHQEVREDYDTYPTYQKDIAEHNIRAILGNVCEESSVDSQGFSCEQTVCIEYFKGDPCRKEREIDLYQPWSSFDILHPRVCVVEPGIRYWHLYANPDQCRMFVNFKEQQGDLRRALFVYIRER